MLVKDVKGRTVARIYTAGELQFNDNPWLTENTDGIQVAHIRCINYKTEFPAHRHIMRPRLANYTEEAIYVVQGTLNVTIYDDEKSLLTQTELTPGSLVVTHRGYHEYKATKETVFLEFKNGPFTSVTEDKTYLT